MYQIKAGFTLEAQTQERVPALNRVVVYTKDKKSRIGQFVASPDGQSDRVDWYSSFDENAWQESKSCPQLTARLKAHFDATDVVLLVSTKSVTRKSEAL